MKLVLTPEESIRLTDAVLDQESTVGGSVEDLRNLDNPAAYRISRIVVDLPGFDHALVPVEVSKA